MSQRETVFLVDGSGYIFRAYFAVRRLTNSKGVPTNAVFGFTNMLLKVIKEFDPKYIAVTFDLPSPTFRHHMYSEYKANRPSPPEDLVPQFALIHRVVEALAMPVITLEGFEADDLLGSLARQAVAAGYDVKILTGDKDLMQLVDDNVRLYDGMKNQHIGSEQVLERFGVTPNRVVDVLALAGDSSDNVPGVQGIGEKTAAVLVQEYGDLEQVLAAAPNIKQKMRRERLLAQADVARLSKRLVTIDDQAPVVLDLDALRYSGPDAALAQTLFEELEFKRLLNDLGGGQPATNTTPMPIVEVASVVDRSRYRAVTDAADLAAVVDKCRQAGRFAIDTETDSIDPMRAQLVGVSLSWQEGEAVYIPCGHDANVVPQQLSPDQVMQTLSPLLADPELVVVAQNAKYDLCVLRRHHAPHFRIGGDPMLASYLLEPGELSHGLDNLAKRYLQHRNMTYEEVCGSGKSIKPFAAISLDVAVAYAAEDADVALRLEHLLHERLRLDNLEKLYLELELPLEEVLCDIEMEGVLVDVARLKLMAVEMEQDLEAVAQRCVELAGHDFNIASPKQVAQVLFEELGLPAQKKTKTGASTDASVLEALASMHALPAQLLEHRMISKLKNTYVDALPRQLNPQTGRVHTQFNQAVAATGRLSSTDPNLQNIPVRSAQGRRVREAFIAPPGRILLSADYSQIELRILAHVSQDPRLIEAFAAGQDVHTRTASEIFALPLEEVSARQRSEAKAINFGLLYGMGAHRLSRELAIPYAQAKTYIETYFDRYAAVRIWHDQALQTAHETGRVETLFGRRRYLREISSRNHNLRAQAERIAINTPIQGTAADIIKRAMLVAARELSAAAPSARMILQVHDELIVEVDRNERDAAEHALVAAMQNAAQLLVPLIVDVGMGSSWAEAH